MRWGLVTALLAFGLAAPAAGAANPPPLPARAQLLADRARFLQLAEQGLQQTRQLWWNAQAGWYKQRSNSDPPIASTWGAAALMEATAAATIAEPTRANRKAANRLFRQAEGYWDPTLGNGTGGVSWLWGLRDTGNAYFDDTGWWGVAYLDAYRATQNKRWLWDAARALGYIDRFGWDRAGGGGTWWNVAHDHKTSEPLAAGALIAATLYRIKHKRYFLEIARRYIGWADAKTRNPSQGYLYSRSDTDGTVMDYVEGMMIGADAELCAAKVRGSCGKAQALANAALNQFPIDADWAPETDVIYLRWLLDLYQRDRNPRWYAVVYRNASRAASNARDAQGLWSLRWDGQWTLPGTLYTQAATVQLFAWLAGAKPPA